MECKARLKHVARTLLLAAAASAAPLLGVTASASAGTLDQQQTDFSVGTGTVDSSETPAQTFTAGLSGGIDQVDLHLESHGPTTPLTVEIRDTSGSAPGATVLAAQSVPASSISTVGSWVTVNFAIPAPVTAGTQYAVLAYSSPVSMVQHYDWGYGGNSYADGRFTYATSSPPSTPWTTGSAADLAFKTYVALAQPQPVAVPKKKKCKKKKKHKSGAVIAKKKCNKHKKTHHH